MLLYDVQYITIIIKRPGYFVVYTTCCCKFYKVFSIPKCLDFRTAKEWKIMLVIVSINCICGIYQSRLWGLQQHDASFAKLSLMKTKEWKIMLIIVSIRWFCGMYQSRLWVLQQHVASFVKLALILIMSRWLSYLQLLDWSQSEKI